MYQGHLLDLDDTPNKKTARRPAPKNIPVTNVPIRRVSDGAVAFIMTFFNREPKEFMVVPGGGNDIYAALRARGLSTDDYFATIWEVH